MNSAEDGVMIRSLVVVGTLPRGTRPIRTIILVDTERADRWLVGAATFFTVAVLIHSADHLRRGTDAVNRDVFWLGTAGAAIEVAVVVLVCQRHRVAPLAAAVAGATLASGYLAVHFLPAHPWFSDSFTSASDVSPASWFAASLEVT